LCVLVSRFHAQTKWKRAWMLATLLPLSYSAWHVAPVDFFAPYRLPRVAGSPRVHVKSAIAGGQVPAREEYRRRAAASEPLFGAVTGLRYVINRSPDRMHSLLSRIVEERHAAGAPRYLQLALGPEARIIGASAPAASVDQAIALFERGADVAPAAVRSARGAVRVLRDGQSLRLEVVAAGPALVMVNQSYFAAWTATMRGEELATMPVNVDRLGVLVPRSGLVELRFSRYRREILLAWLLSLLLVAALPLIEITKRRAREVERAGDEDGALGAR
jgi:hypothetical protein